MGKFNFKNQEDFKKIKTEAETLYTTIQDVFRPYFRVKVIIKEVYGGQKHFWSVIPFWGIDKITSKRILYSGDPEHD